MAKRALSVKEVSQLRKLGTHRVDRNLYLQIKENGARSWLFRWKEDGRMRNKGLGAYRDVPLQEARDTADELRLQLRRGVDLFAERDEARRAKCIEASKNIPSFKWCAEQYIEAHEAEWRNEKHRAQWRSTLKNYVDPVFGSKLVSDVTRNDVLAVLEPIWRVKTETANRLRGRIQIVLDWAKAAGYREGENPAVWAGGLEYALPAPGKVQKVQHHEAVPYAEMPSLTARIRELDSTGSKALLFTILTLARTGEALGARWSEIDLDAKVWTVPADRMKAGREHRVPLPDTAVELLKSLPRSGDLLFPGARKGRSLSNMTMLKALRSIRGDGETVHGFRATFSTWAREQTEQPREIIESCLAHTVGNAVEQAYNRSDYLERRRALMADWAGFLMGEAR